MSKCAIKVERIEMVWHREDMEYFKENAGEITALDKWEISDKCS